jgi:hypothetical protein
MAFSGSISGGTFNALKVVDHAFRRCRLPAQQISSEMQTYALESLYLMLSEMANIKAPSWCIEKLILPFYENQPIVPMPLGTVDILNLNYRTIQALSGTVTTTSTSYKVQFSSATTVNTVGIKWSATSVPVTFQVSSDNVTWTTVGSDSDIVDAGTITWNDIDAALSYLYFRITSPSTLAYTAITLGNTPSEVPFGELNRDSYVQQNNQVFAGRPVTYWFQRDIPNPVVHLWPVPNAASEQAQCIVWRHRQIMDTENLQQEVEVPQRWLEAIVNGLAARVAAETPQVDASLIPVLEQKAALSLQRAWDGDNDGSPTFINPGIGCYTK